MDAKITNSNENKANPVNYSTQGFTGDPILEYEQYIFTNGQWQWKPLTSEYTITAPKNEKYNLDTATGTFKFLPGFQYTVKIAVYGLSPIKVTANISNWKEGGDIFINPDDADNIGLDN